MNSRVLQLNTDELTSAWSAINPVHVLSEELVERAEPERGPAGRFHSWPPADDLVLLEDLRAGRRCVLPAETLIDFHTAALMTVAARTLVAPGVVTAAVLGSGSVLQVLLALITRHVSGLSHIAVCPAGGAHGPFEPGVVDLLDRAGVGWSATDVPAEAALGATLVVTMSGPAGVGLGPPAAGALLIGTAESDFSDDVLDSVSQIYVDDLTLVDRAGRNGRRQRRVEADLGRVLSGAHPGRTHVDDILLVELLGAHRLDVRLASELHRAALVRGLGIQLDEMIVPSGQNEAEGDQQ
jgi:ornithine cyclodeaminase/alanine dehydrogenase-like protein (mu-crystallin family)